MLLLLSLSLFPLFCLLRLLLLLLLLSFLLLRLHQGWLLLLLLWLLLRRGLLWLLIYGIAFRPCPRHRTSGNINRWDGRGTRCGTRYRCARRQRMRIVVDDEVGNLDAEMVAYLELVPMSTAWYRYRL